MLPHLVTIDIKPRFVFDSFRFELNYIEIKPTFVFDSYRLELSNDEHQHAGSKETSKLTSVSRCSVVRLSGNQGSL